MSIVDMFADDAKKRRPRRAPAKRSAASSVATDIPVVAVDFTKVGARSLRRYARHFNLATRSSPPTKIELVNAATRHFATGPQVSDPDAVVAAFLHRLREDLADNPPPKRNSPAARSSPPPPPAPPAPVH
ncbi:Histone deacetylase complex subunit SAP30 Sin3 binding domain-containing protein [Plasmodiophora brassicae]